MSANRRPSAVVFDLDGLMFTTEDMYQEVSRELLGRRGKTFENDLTDAIMGRTNHVALQIMIEWHALEDTVEQLIEEMYEMIPRLLDKHLAPMKGVGPLLNALERANVPKAIATGSGRRFAEEVLGRFQWLDRFEFLLTCDDVTRGKPDPEIYLAAAERLGRAPADILVLEDSQTGCRAAVAAGTCAVAVPAGLSLRHDFAGSHFVAESLADPRIYQLLGLPHDDNAG
jgi:HAD superfamily hydrolase (TIGR01509 family)